MEIGAMSEYFRKEGLWFKIIYDPNLNKWTVVVRTRNNHGIVAFSSGSHKVACNTAVVKYQLWKQKENA